MANTKENVIGLDYIRIGEKTAFSQKLDMHRKKRHGTAICISLVMISLLITYIILINKFFLLITSM